MEEVNVKIETSNTLQGSPETMLPLQLLEFKTSLLEAVEELRISRAAKIQYEEQINKILMEKQELMWQNESLLNQSEILDKQHKEALSTMKKQVQTKMHAIEEEKGQLQLAAETKAREINGLKEDLKSLQMAKYNLQKKLQEMEQKVQMHMLAKEDHIKHLSEFEKCFASISRQFAVVKAVHEKLEQNVQEAIQQNKTLKTENKERHQEISNLKEEIKEMTSDLIKYKVACQQSASEEKISIIEKDQQLKQLQQKLQTEVLKSLKHMLELIQRHVQTIEYNEKQLTSLKKEYQTLERDNELQRAKAKENEEKFLALRNEYTKALEMRKMQEESMSLDSDNKDLEIANKQLQESYMDLSQNKNVNKAALKDDGILYAKWINMTPHNQEIEMTAQSMEECSLGSAAKKIEDLSVPQNVNNMKHEIILDEDEKSESIDKGDEAQVSTAGDTVNQASGGECSNNIQLDITFSNTSDICEERYSQCTPCIKSPAFVQSVSKPIDVSSRDVSQQTEINKQKSTEDNCKDVSNKIDKLDDAENGKGVLTNEQHKYLLAETKRHEHILGTENISSGIPTACLFKLGNTYQVQKGNNLNLNTVLCYDEHTKQCKTEQKQMEDEKHTRICSDMLLCTHTCREKQNSVVTISMEKPNDEMYNTNYKGSSDFPEGHYKKYNSSTEELENIVINQKNDLSVFPVNQVYKGEQIYNAAYSQTIPLLESDDQYFQKLDITGIQKTQLNNDTYNAWDYPVTKGTKEHANKSKFIAQEDICTLAVCKVPESRKVTLLEETRASLDTFTDSSSVSGITDTDSQTLLNKMKINQNTSAVSCVSDINQCANLLIKDVIIKQSSIMKDIQINPSEESHMMCAVASQKSSAKAEQELNCPILPVFNRDHKTELNTMAQTLSNSTLPREHSDLKEKLNTSSLSSTNLLSIPSTSGYQEPIHQAPREKRANILADATLQEESGGFAHCRIQDQMNKIEKFLSGQKLKPSKKRKLDENYKPITGGSDEPTVS